MLNICQRMNSIEGIDTLTSFFVTSLAQLFEANKVSFMLLDDIEKELCIKASEGLDQAIAQTKLKVGELFGGLVAKEGKPILVKDVENEFPDLPRSRLSRYTTKSFVIVPVEYKGKIFGVINVTDKKNNELFTEDDLKLANTMSSYLALHMENSRLSEKNKNLTVQDSLTGLYTHSYFYGQLFEEINRAERYKRGLSIMLLDIDNFSEYNINHGYAAGDNVLKRMASLIKENVRQVDIVARYGLDEFAIILPETKLKEAIFVGEKIREKISLSVFTDDEYRKSALGMARLTVSVGISEHTVGLNKEELIRHASGAVFEAKQKGQNCVCVFK